MKLQQIRDTAGLVAKFVEPILLAAMVAGCVVATSSSGPEGATRTLDPAASTPTPISTPSHSAGTLPSVKPVPSGAWTSIDWLAVPVGYSPAVKVSEAGVSDAFLHGWSKGYVEFIWDQSRRILTPWASPDGLRWRSGPTLDTSLWNAYVKLHDDQTADRIADDPNWHDECYFRVDSFEESAGIALMAGTLSCNPDAICLWRSDYYSDQGRWWSSDGLTWNLVESLKPKPLPARISGGPGGFIELRESRLRTSTDARSWTPGTLPQLSAGSTLSGVASLEGGFLLAGVVQTRAGASTEGCPGTDEALYRGSLWRSAHGTAWEAITLPGAVSSRTGVTMDLVRVDDRTALARESVIGTEGVATVRVEWASRDGKSWTSLVGAPLDPLALVAGRSVGLFRAPYESLAEPLSLVMLNDQLKPVTLEATGAPPADRIMQIAIGPTGVLATDNGTRFWLGVPSVR